MKHKLDKRTSMLLISILLTSALCMVNGSYWFTHSPGVSLPFPTSVTLACLLLPSYAKAAVSSKTLGYTLEDLDLTMHVQDIQFTIRLVPTDDHGLFSHGPAAADNNL